MPDSSPATTVPAASGKRLKPWQALMRVRKASGRTLKDCARHIGISARRYQSYELGKREPSLPEAEQLAHYLGAPIEVLLGEQEWAEPPLPPGEIEEFIGLRARIVGARLRLARHQLDMDLPALARATGLRAAEIEKFELATRPIPISKLNVLMRELGISREDLLRYEGDGAERTREQTAAQHAAFDKLPDDVRETLLDPDALSSLRTGIRLRGFTRKDLRKAAKSLQKLASAMAR
jgi:transcriptional regulator with XRE-family HTH domain